MTPTPTRTRLLELLDVAHRIADELSWLTDEVAEPLRMHAEEAFEHAAALAAALESDLYPPEMEISA